MQVFAFDGHGLGKLRTEIRARAKLAEEGLGQGLGAGGGLRIGLRDLRGAAFGVGAGQRHGLFGGKSESDKERRVVDIDRNRLPMRIDRLFERKGEVKGEHAFVVFGPIVDRRLQLEELVVLARQMHEGEVVELLERLDIDLGERSELGLRIGAVLVGIETLDRHRGVELVERPGMTNGGNAVIWPEHDLGANRSPDMGMGGNGGRAATQEGCGEKSFEKALVPQEASRWQDRVLPSERKPLLGANYGGFGGLVPGPDPEPRDPANRASRRRRWPRSCRRVSRTSRRGCPRGRSRRSESQWRCRRRSMCTQWLSNPTRP